MKKRYIPLLKKYFWIAALESLLIAIGASVMNIPGFIIGVLLVFFSFPIAMHIAENQPYRRLDKILANDVRLKIRAVFHADTSECGCVLYALPESLFVACYDFRPRFDFELPYELMKSVEVSQDRMRLCMDDGEFEFDSKDVPAMAILLQSLLPGSRSLANPPAESPNS